MTDPLEQSTRRRGLILRRDALRQGYTDGEIRLLRRRGELIALRRGGYVWSGAASQHDQEREHLLLIEATLAGLRESSVVSHTSAAVMHGMPLWATDLSAVHVTRQPPARTRRSATVRCHVAALDADDVVEIGGVLVTSAARTIIDLARIVPFEQAVVTADAALRAEVTTPGEMRGLASRMAGIRGMRNAHRVAWFADGRSESVGESRSRVMMLEGFVPRPQLQVEVRGLLGELVGFTDFGWEKGKLLGEFDGRIKYGRLLQPGQTAGDAVFFEKQREDAMRATGALMVRWVWDDLATPRATNKRIMRALAIVRGHGR